MTNPYPIPRQVRQTEILVGNGGAVYGPFDGLKIFDLEDVKVYSRADEDARFAETAVTVEKVDGLPFDYFTIEFGANLPVTSEYVVVSQRVAERSAGVNKGTLLDMTALEKELSKVATVQQELRRDFGRTLMMDFGETPLTIDAGIRDGFSLVREGDRLVEGFNSGDIGNAQEYAEAAGASAFAAAGSAGAAAGSAGAAGGSAVLASKFANDPEDTEVIPGSGLYSTKHYLAKVTAIWGQVLVGIAAAFHAATGKTAIDDADEFGFANSNGAWALGKVTFANLITSIFKTTRTIANARFEGSTFGLILSAFRLTIAGVLTAARTITVPDRDITLGMVRLSGGPIPANVAVDWAVTSGPRRYVMVLSAYSTNGTGVPMLQLKAGGAAETSGYSGGSANSGSGTGLANSSGFYFNSGNSAALSYDVVIELILVNGNTWIFRAFGSNAGPGTVGGGGSKTLAGPIDGLRLTTPGAVNVPDNGEYALYAEY
ncbi:Hypothetical protein NGAL_HAMBI2605_59070 [Neorhizobium galegae bv. orientalis]|nr:Hypothetical protein NGAL_HAMBI2605_59070 [Neorhizobium galegae bv. orientalis]